MAQAVHAFQKDNKERLEAIKDAHKEIHQSLKDARPQKPERPELTAEIKAKVEVLKENKRSCTRPARICMKTSRTSPRKTARP